MKRMPFLALVLVTIVLSLSTSYAQTYDLQFVLAQNGGGVFAVTAQIRSNASTFGMGTSNLVFTYDTSAIGTPVLDAAFNFSGGLYDAVFITAPVANRVSINIVYNGNAGSGTTVPGSYINIVRIRFTTKKPTGHSNLQWRTTTPNQTGVFNDGAALMAKGTLNGFDITLGVSSIAPRALPSEYSLSQNYPNPFNPSTVIEFTLPKDAHVKLEVYNIIGQKVMTLVDEVRQAGYHSVKLDGTNLASGMYLCRLTTGEQTFTKKLLLTK